MRWGVWLVVLVAVTNSGFAGTLPNILFFMADDHGVLDSSVYGSATIRTPKMQSLAQEGMVFQNAYVASPACGPSRSALLSGLMPARNGAEGNHVKPRAETQIMVAQLQRLGYEVAAIGKVAHGSYGTLCGFDYYKTKRTKLTEQVRTYLTSRGSQPRRGRGGTSSLRPLCLLVGDRRPHVSWTKNSIYNPDEIILPEHFIDTPQTRSHWARYLSDITGMDAEMAAVDKLMREHVGSDDYICIYSSDHGGQWPFGKWNLYDAGIRVPLIVRWPERIAAGSQTEAMVNWVDLFPTLIDIAGGQLPDDIDGMSFADILLGQTSSHREAIYTTHTGDGAKNVYPIRSVRTQRYKYIRNLLPHCYHSNHSDIDRKDGAGAYWDSWDARERVDPWAASVVARYYARPAIEFFDLEADPNELNNLAEAPEHLKRIAAMSLMLDTWMEAQGDQQRVDRDPYPLSGPRPVEIFAQQP